MNGSEYMYDQTMPLSDIFQIFQTDMAKQITSFTSKLDLFLNRIDNLELRQKQLEDKLNSSPSDATSSSSSTPSDVGKRQRLTPTAMQVLVLLVFSMSDSITILFIQSRIRQLHNSFDDEKQFRPDEKLV